MKRAVIIVLDSLGIGALPDAAAYGDQGSHTLRSIAAAPGGLSVPHLEALGLGCIQGVEGVRPVAAPAGAYGRLQEASKGKDTITGHWEIAGLLTLEPFKTYPHGFPGDFIAAYEEAIGRQVLGNLAASGTEIIQELGPLHEETGRPIVYTSADSVFQVAANTAVIPLELLYDFCLKARQLLVGPWACGRVIARPYVMDEAGNRVRTADRKDYAVSPPAPTLLDRISASGMEVHTVGKIKDIFNGSGITHSVHTDSNEDGVNKTLEELKLDFPGLLFTNLVDFDSLYGHRRDAAGYARALEAFDARLPELLAALKPGDLLFLCADHGNDPAHTGWDHTREAVPLLLAGSAVAGGCDLGVRETFGDIAATILDYLDLPQDLEIGRSLLARALGKEA